MSVSRMFVRLQSLNFLKCARRTAKLIKTETKHFSALKPEVKPVNSLWEPSELKLHWNPHEWKQKL